MTKKGPRVTKERGRGGLLLRFSQELGDELGELSAIDATFWFSFEDIELIEGLCAIGKVFEEPGVAFSEASEESFERVDLAPHGFKSDFHSLRLVDGITGPEVSVWIPFHRLLDVCRVDIWRKPFLLTDIREVGFWTVACGLSSPWVPLIEGSIDLFFFEDSEHHDLDVLGAVEGSFWLECSVWIPCDDSLIFEKTDIVDHVV